MLFLKCFCYYSFPLMTDVVSWAFRNGSQPVIFGVVALPFFFPRPILDIVSMSTFFRSHILKERYFVLAASKQTPFLSISNKNIFFNTQQKSRIGPAFSLHV